MKIRRIALWLYSLTILLVAISILLLGVLFACVFAFHLFNHEQVLVIFVPPVQFIMFITLGLLMAYSALMMPLRLKLPFNAWLISCILLAVVIGVYTIRNGFCFGDTMILLFYFAMPLAKCCLVDAEASTP